jgi:hypothetical protein
VVRRQGLSAARTRLAGADQRAGAAGESAAAIIALLRYGNGVPWNRTEGLEANLGIPLRAATQCEIKVQTAHPLQPALEELKRQAAQAEVVALITLLLPSFVPALRGSNADLGLVPVLRGLRNPATTSF